MSIGENKKVYFYSKLYYFIIFNMNIKEIDGWLDWVILYWNPSWRERRKVKDSIFAVIDPNLNGKWVFLKDLWIWEEHRKRWNWRKIMDYLRDTYWKVTWKIGALSNDDTWYSLTIEEVEEFYESIWCSISTGYFSYE